MKSGRRRAWENKKPAGNDGRLYVQMGRVRLVFNVQERASLF
jgi:hypothetical protein